MARMGQLVQTFTPVDPVCGRRLSLDGTGTRVSEYKRRKYFFCSETCQRTFQAQTERFRLHELARAGALMNLSGVHWGLA